MTATVHNFPRGQRLHADRLAVHVMNSDPSSALHGEPAARRRTPWLALCIVLGGLLVLVWCYARWLWGAP
jgi:hypothetical protein